MRTSLLSMLFFCAGLSLPAQETRLTIEVVPGRLGELLTQEQWASVTHLSLTGEMCNGDFKSLYGMPCLVDLDLSGVSADSIPEEGFRGIAKLEHIAMSPDLEYIGYDIFDTDALRSITWIRYPKEMELGAFNDDFGCENLCEYLVPEGHPEYVSEDGILFTKDGKTLVAFPPGKKRTEDWYYAVPDGVEEIHANAFSGALLRELELPSSLKYIGDRALYVYCLYLTGDDTAVLLLETLTCHALVPPSLGKEPFINQWRTHLVVPEESRELYGQAPEWRLFQGVVSLDEALVTLRYGIEGNTLHLKGASSLLRVEVVNMAGQVLVSRSGLSDEESIALPAGSEPELLLLRVVRKDGSSETVKLAR